MSRTPENSTALLDDVVKSLYDLVTALEVSSEPPEELTGIEGYSQLYSTLLEVRTAIKALSSGELACKVVTKGYLPGSVKALQASLHHLTWQAKSIASGDFTQRVDFMGDFSGAFNEMVEQLDKSRAEFKNKSENEFRGLAESMPQIVWITRADGWNVYFNRQWAEYTGLALEESHGHAWIKSLHPDDRQQGWEIWQNALKNGTAYAHECRLRRADGIYRWWLFRGVPMMDEHGAIAKWFGTCTEIDDIKTAQEEKLALGQQILQSQKMEAVGQLAGGVAHDFNNMLSVIIGYAELALMKLQPSQPNYAALVEIRKAAERSADLTRQLLAFARKQTIVPKVIDLNETIAGMLKMLIGENIELTLQSASNLWAVKVDPTQIDQMLANLCVNARDAITDLGRITIETGNYAIDSLYCDIHEYVEPGNYVRLVVSDNGCGMDKETRHHIFEPFFTTKGVGEGTGLGLATVYGIVKQNNGFINVYSEQGLGTTFTICIPRYIGENGDAHQDGAARPLPCGSETILLVEDEPSILIMASLMLEEQGYTVLTAGTAAEALRQFRSHTGSIHLLVTDVIMPDMNGRALAKELLLHDSELKCLFMSGYTADVIAHHGVLEEGVNFIQKPFSLQDMANKVREVLDGN